MSPRYFTSRTVCPACHSPERATLYRRSYQAPEIVSYLEQFYGAQGRYEPEYLVGAEYILDQCGDCGLVYQEQIPDDRLLDRLYEHWIAPPQALEMYTKTRRLDGVSWATHHLEEMHRHLGAQPYELRVLDFGMGWGSWCHLARGFGCDVFGMELSESRCRHAQDQGLKVTSWEQAEEMSFDIVHTEQVFEHLPRPLDTLQRLLTLLRPGGLIYISVPNGGDILKRLESPDWSAPKGSSRSLNAVAPLEHLNCFFADSLVEMAQRAGLQPLSTLAPAPELSRHRRLIRRARRLYRQVRGLGTRRIFRKTPDAGHPS